MVKPHIHPKFSLPSLAHDVVCNFDAFLSNTETREHSHHWGQVQLISGGVLEMQANNTRFLAPPHLAIWVPAGTRHKSYNRTPIEYCSVNISDHFSSRFPEKTSLISVTPIVSAIIDDFRLRQITNIIEATDLRMAAVLIDQLSHNCVEEQFLPSSTHKYLAPILSHVELSPEDDLSLAQWAERVHTSERTLARCCQSELGMSFTEWRLRAKYMKSLDLLKNGSSVKEAALTLGYRQASPFIQMFKRYAAITPEQYRQRFYPVISALSAHN